jgi:integrase
LKLTQDTVAKLALPPGKSEHIAWDSGIPGFAVRLRPHSATWFFRYRRGARQPRVTIGAVSAISAAQARTIASQLYAKVKLGKDPAGERAEALERMHETFASVLKPYLVRRQAELRPRSYKNCARHLLRQAAPLHRLELVKAAERRTVASLLTKIATKNGPVEANCVKSSLSGFFTWMIGQGLIEGTDPTAGMAGAVTNGPRTHVPTDADMVKIWGALQDDDYGDIVRLLTLTLCRLTEIGGLRWDEIKFQAGVIELSPARVKTGSKTGQGRRLPMSAPVKEILQRHHRQWDGARPWVFGMGENGFTGWARAKRNLDKRAGVTGWTLHDFRRWGSTTMNNEGIALPHVIEACLGHVVGNRVARTYNLSAYDAQVQVALELWAKRTTDLMAGGRRDTRVLALRRRKGA